MQIQLTYVFFFILQIIHIVIWSFQTIILRIVNNVLMRKKWKTMQIPENPQIYYSK